VIENEEIAYYKKLQYSYEYILTSFTGIIPKELVINVYYKKQSPLNFDNNSLDSIFPPVLKSLIFLNKSNQINKLLRNSDLVDVSSYKFIKLSTMRIYYDYFLSTGKVKIIPPLEPPREDNIISGTYGNFNFGLCVIKILNRMRSIQSYFPNADLQENKLYEVKVIIQGKPKLVTIDDTVPSIRDSSGYNVPAFLYCKSDPRLSLIEKAYAKISRSYCNSLRNLCSEIFPVLTESPMKDIHHTSQNNEEIWEQLNINYQNKSIIFSEFDTIILEQYAVEYFTSFFINKIFTTRGETKYLELSFLSDSISSRNIKNKLQYPIALIDLKDKQFFPEEKLKKENIIFITFEKFVNTFNKTFFIHIIPEYQYQYKKFKQNPTRYNMVRLNVSNLTNLHVTLHLKSSRFTGKENIITPISRLVLMKYKAKEEISGKTESKEDSKNLSFFESNTSFKKEEFTKLINNLGSQSDSTNSYKMKNQVDQENGFEYISSSYGRKERHLINNLLSPGLYYIMFKVYYENQQDQSVVISTYSDNLIEMEEENDQTIIDKNFDFTSSSCIFNLFNSYLEKIPGEKIKNQEEMKIFKALNLQNFGYSMIKFENSSKNKILNVRLKYTGQGMKCISHINKKIETLGSSLISKIQEEFYLKIYAMSKDIVIFEWEKNNDEISINTDYAYEIEIPPFSFDRKDFFNLFKTSITKDIYYYEVPSVDGIYILICNESNKDYIVKTDLNLSNLFVELPQSEANIVTIFLTKISKSYIKLKFEANKSNITYNASYKLSFRIKEEKFKLSSQQTSI
jgi:hypothetical protein